jgi:hypothetical protein
MLEISRHVSAREVDEVESLEHQDGDSTRGSASARKRSCRIRRTAVP